MYMIRNLIILLLALVATKGSAIGSQPFPQPHNTQEITTPFLSAEEAIKGINLPEGFTINLFAGEPHVNQPIAMTWDARGRLWVAECYTYAKSGIKFDTNLRDRILIFEDTNQDGRFDKRTVFWDQAQRLTSIAVGHGGVWATCAPNFLFIPDKNGDDVPDGDPVILLDGWEGNPIGHNIVNGLKWGIDGWLYGRHGITTTSHVGTPGTPQEERRKLRCSIWRYHPIRHSFEVVCEGTTNPWGHDWDEHGQLFFINTVIGHLWHGVPGAYFKRMHGQHFNKHLYELIDQTADHYHWDKGKEHWADLRKGMTTSTDQAGGGHAHCGMMIYQGQNWPTHYQGKVFTANLHGRRINCDRLQRKGTGYTGKHEPDFMKITDPWFRGIEIDYGPNGEVYILDWSDIGECHENDGVHRTSGRIYRIIHGKLKKPKFGDLRKMNSLELAHLQADGNEWHARKARLILQERGNQTKSTPSEGKAREFLLRTLTEHEDVRIKLRALWTLHTMRDGLSENMLQKLLDHEEEHLRLWATRLLADDGKTPSNQSINAMTRLADQRKLWARPTLPWLQPCGIFRAKKKWQLATQLASKEAFVEDPVLPLMIWYGIEPAVVGNPAKALELVRATQMPKLRQFIPRRLAAN